MAADEPQSKDDEQARTPVSPAAAAPRATTFWVEHRGQLIVGIVLLLASSLLTPFGGFVLGVADSVRDVGRRVLDYDAGRVDDLRERVEDRPYWQEDPKFLDRSGDFLSDDASTDVLSVDEDLSPVVVSVDEIVRKGVDYNGRPVVVVGRLKSYTSLEGGGVDFGKTEAVLTGEDPRNFIIAGDAGVLTAVPSSDREIGRAVVLSGVVFAVGRIKVAGHPIGQDSAYFASTRLFTTDEKQDRLLHPYLEALKRSDPP